MFLIQLWASWKISNINERVFDVRLSWTKRRKNGILLEMHGSSPCTYDNTACSHRVDIRSYRIGSAFLHLSTDPWHSWHLAGTCRSTSELLQRLPAGRMPLLMRGRSMLYKILVPSLCSRSQACFRMVLPLSMGAGIAFISSQILVSRRCQIFG